MLQKIWYQTLSIHSTYWFDQSMFFFVFFLLPKLAFLVLSLANFIFFSHFSFFLMKSFCLDGFKDHPTSVDKDKLRKFANSKGLCLSTWVMSMLIGQILHCREAEGWTVSNHAHMNVSKEKVRPLFLIKHLTPEKRDTPLFLFFFKKWIWWFARKISDSKCDNLFLFPSSLLQSRFIHMRWDAWYGLKKTMYMPLWRKTTIATRVCAQEALTHLYVDATKEYNAWYATNWKNLHEM